MYKNKLLTIERLQFIMKECIKYLKVSSKLIKRLMKDKNVYLLDIIFKNLKFYDLDLVLMLLFIYNNKTAISTLDLNQLISNEKYKIIVDPCCSIYLKKDVGKYLDMEFKKKCINMYTIKYLIKHGVDINKIIWNDGTPLFIACEKGNKIIIKYLVEHGAYIDKGKKNGETPLFNACKNGNEVVVKYLVEKGADINKKRKDGETPLFSACMNGNVVLIKYLVEQGAIVNK